MLHYKRGIFGLRSLVDDPKFFADPNGKHDPRAELRATIRSFFRPVVEGETHPVCRFVARFEWLKEKLNIDESRLPVPRCEEFEALLAQIRPESVTLIFPTSHMNSPASMYGHTLLTIETASKSRLLAYAVNYSALIQGETFAPIYVGKGLLGGYPGYYSILPYYAKLQEYSDVDDRDIWEYPLNLDRAEVRRLILHVAEMENIYSRYYFFGENCSYGLMFLLEAARPSLHLTDQFGWWVIPLDTIRAMKASGLFTDAVYRPSKSTKINYLSALLTPKLRQEAWEVAHGKREPAEVLAQGHSEGREDPPPRPDERGSAVRLHQGGPQEGSLPAAIPEDAGGPEHSRRHRRVALLNTSSGPPGRRNRQKMEGGIRKACENAPSAWSRLAPSSGKLSGSSRTARSAKCRRWLSGRRSWRP